MVNELNAIRCRDELDDWYRFKLRFNGSRERPNGSNEVVTVNDERLPGRDNEERRGRRPDSYAGRCPQGGRAGHHERPPQIGCVLHWSPLQGIQRSVVVPFIS